MGLLMALMTVTLGVCQHVSGLGVTMLCTGLAFYFYRLIFGERSQPPNVTPFKPVPIPVLTDIPVIGPDTVQPVRAQLSRLCGVALAAFLLNRTPWGLNLRTVGENPRAADAAGVNVAAMRYQALVLSGALDGDRRRLSLASPSSTPSPSASFPGAAGSASRSSSSANGDPGAAPLARSCSPSSTRSSFASRPAA